MLCDEFEVDVRGHRIFDTALKLMNGRIFEVASAVEYVCECPLYNTQVRFDRMPVSEIWLARNANDAKATCGPSELTNRLLLDMASQQLLCI
jgi:hypothetical protein